MKLNAVVLISFAVLSAACSKNAGLNSTHVGETNPTVETQAQVVLSTSCTLADTILQQPGAIKLKDGLDSIVKEMPEEDVETLAEAARVWRRANPSEKYSNKVADEKATAGVAVLNSTAARMVLLGLVEHAPVLKLTGGSMFAHVAGYPAPNAGSTEKSTIRQMYFGIPSFGVTYGEAFADSGFSVFGQLYTDVGEKHYTVNMIYSAAASKYGVRITEDGDFVNAPIKSEDCRKSKTMAAFVKMPRAQTTIQECEFNGCKNIPKD